MESASGKKKTVLLNLFVFAVNPDSVCRFKLHISEGLSLAVEMLGKSTRPCTVLYNTVGRFRLLHNIE